MKPECYHAPCQWSADACSNCEYDMDCYEHFDSKLFKGAKQMEDYLKPCDLYGCYYNDDGICKYKDNPIQIPSERACYQEDIEAYLDSVE